jgi:ADP-ribose pyrophosphatase
MKTERESDSHALLYEGRYLNFRSAGSWEYVERRNISGIVGIVAVTDDQRIILTEQFRPPVNCRVIELPAGLAGDVLGSENEALAEAAKRELLEETGYEAASMRRLTEGPTSPGQSSEVISLFLAEGLIKKNAGGGDATEAIEVHEIPLRELTGWLEKKRRAGCLTDYKIFAALYLRQQAADG